MPRTHIGLIAIALTGALAACEGASKAESSDDEMVALRTEIASLRTEVTALRKAIESLDPARADGSAEKTAEAEPAPAEGAAADDEPAAESKPKSAKKKSGSGSSGGGGGKKDEVRMPGDG